MGVFGKWFGGLKFSKKKTNIRVLYVTREMTAMVVR